MLFARAARASALAGDGRGTDARRAEMGKITGTKVLQASVPVRFPGQNL